MVQLTDFRVSESAYLLKTRPHARSQLQCMSLPDGVQASVDACQKRLTRAEAEGNTASKARALFFVSRGFVLYAVDGDTSLSAAPVRCANPWEMLSCRVALLQ